MKNGKSNFGFSYVEKVANFEAFRWKFSSSTNSEIGTLGEVIRQVNLKKYVCLFLQAGREILYSYTDKIAMKKLEFRKEVLLECFGFSCCCELCREEEICNDDKTYDLYKTLSEEAKKSEKNLEYFVNNWDIEIRLLNFSVVRA